jgi:fatty-acyl-CoA synthase
VQEFLRGRIASYKIPRRVLFVSEDDLSLTANDKIRSDSLRELAMSRLSRGAGGESGERHRGG